MGAGDVALPDRATAVLRPAPAAGDTGRVALNVAMKHWLEPLLQPRSIAVVGASARARTVGNTLLLQLRHGGYAGRVHAINPRYREVAGYACHPHLQALAEAPEHVALAVADARVEEALEQAIAAGVRAVTIFSSLVDADGGGALRERVAARVRAAGISLCGAMCMGFYNFAERVWLCGFPTRVDHRAGGITLISQSGSAMCALTDCDQRLDFNLVVSSGLETVVTMEDYLDYALQRDDTRVVGLFLETVRQPARFVAGLRRAFERAIPVVVLKVGRSLRGARAAASHSGALVGHDGAFQAVCDRFGVTRVDTLDQLAVTLLMFERTGGIGPGGLVTAHDSGGERGLLMDLAEDEGVEFADLAPATLAGVAASLENGLPAENPLDAWGTGHDWARMMGDCLRRMMADPAAAIGAIVCDRSPDGDIWNDYAAIVQGVRERSGKPMCLVANHQGTGASARVVALSRTGVPALDGARQFLRGVRHLCEWRDSRSPRGEVDVAAALEGFDAIAWRERLLGAGTLYEADALDLLAAAGLVTVAHRVVRTRAQAVAAARMLGHPVALKTAAAVAHKSEVSGVRLALAGDAAIAAAYDDLAARLGPAVLVAKMARPGVEMLLGAVDGAGFGTIVTIAIGGVHAELLADRVTLLAPFGPGDARRALDRLRLRPLLDGVRGAPASDVTAFCHAASRFSRLVADLGDTLGEFDVNPLLVHADGCTAVDALLVARRPAMKERKSAAACSG